MKTELIEREMLKLSNHEAELLIMDEIMFINKVDPNIDPGDVVDDITFQVIGNSIAINGIVLTPRMFEVFKEFIGA